MPRAKLIGGASLAVLLLTGAVMGGMALGHSSASAKPTAKPAPATTPAPAPATTTPTPAQSSDGGTVTVNGQPLAISLQRFSECDTDNLVCYQSFRDAELTLSITNHGNTAVFLQLGNPNPTLKVYISDTGQTSDPEVINDNHVPGYTTGTSVELAPGQTTTSKYVMKMYGPSAVATRVQVGPDASVGSGSVTLPITDSVPGGRQPDEAQAAPAPTTAAPNGGYGANAVTPQPVTPASAGKENGWNPVTGQVIHDACHTDASYTLICPPGIHPDPSDG
jgi:hypothetical protein